MSVRMLKIGAAVPKLKVGDPLYNTEEIISIIREHDDCGLLVFPELSVTGYTCADLFNQQTLLEQAEWCLFDIADETGSHEGLVVVIGLPLRHHNRLYNVAAFCSEGEVKAIIPKQNIPNYGEFYEQRWFTSGKGILNDSIILRDSLVPFGTDLLMEDPDTGIVIGAEICEDLWVPDKPSTHQCMAGAHVIVNLSASDEVIGKQDYRRSMVLNQSSSCYCGYVYVSSGTDESSTDLVFSGHTMIAENGRMLEDHIFPEENAVTTAIVDIDAIEYNRRHQNTYSDNGTRSAFIPIYTGLKTIDPYLPADKLASVLKQEAYPIARNPFVPQDDNERAQRCHRILQIQANGLASRVRHTGIKTLVIGISGGLDSTLALLVCNEARKLVNDIRIIGYTMPNEGNTTSLTYNNAIALMECLDIEIREVAIGDSVNQHLLDIGHGTEYLGEGDTTYENAQARMRTYILMDAANMENGLVVGTGDLSELALGWCTYNGDHMSMYGVNASVPKTLVRYICHAYALSCGDEQLKDVLLSIVDTPITPELTPNENGVIAQKTEEKIGKYDLNDFFLFYVLRYGFEPVKILAFAAVAFPELTMTELKQALRRFYQRFFQQQFKRSCLPDGPKVGSVTLSPRGDWRMPSDASVSLWLKEIEDA